MFSFSNLNSSWWVGLFTLKVVCGVLLWLIYSYHYTLRDTSDAFRYYDDAIYIKNLVFDSPTHFLRFLFGWNLDSPEMQVHFDHFRAWSSSYNYGMANDNPTIIRINVIISFFSFGFYQVHTVFMCFLSTIGIALILRGLECLGLIVRPLLFLLFLLIPSFLFWTSGVLKEAPLIFFIGILLWSLSRLISKVNVKNLLMVGVSVFLMINLKTYVLLSMIPALMFMLIQFKWKWPKVILFSLVHVFCFVVGLSAKLFFPPGDLLYILSKKQQDFYNVAYEVAAGSIVQIGKVDTWIKFLWNLPQALINTYLRPGLWEVNSTITLLAGIENTVLLLLLIGSVFMSIKKRKSIRFNSLSLFCLSIVLTLGAIVGSTVPVLGAVVRYKVPALIFMIVIFYQWLLPVLQEKGRFSKLV